MAGNANSGRKPLPATVHQIRGNPSKKPASELAAAVAAEGEPKSLLTNLPVVAPDPPAFLNAEAKAEWTRVVGVLVTMGLMSEVDRNELAIFCVAYADWKLAREKIEALGESGYVSDTPSGYKQISAWMALANRAEERMTKAGNSFGMSPAARAKFTEVRPPATQGQLFPDEKKDAADHYFG